MVTGSAFRLSRLPQNLGYGQRWGHLTVYRNGPATGSSHRLSTHHSALLPPSIPLVEVTPPFHPTHRPNGDCPSAISPNLANCQEPPNPRGPHNVLVCRLLWQSQRIGMSSEVPYARLVEQVLNLTEYASLHDYGTTTDQRMSSI